MKTAIWSLVILIIVGIGALVVSKHSESIPPVATSTPVVSTSTPSTPVSTPVTDKIVPYGAVKLSLGERAHFADISITPTELVEDSRCPAGVYCIQAGTVRVKLAIFTTATSTQTIKLGDSITTSGVKITLTDVAPLKTASHTITNSEYEFTLRVERVSSPVVSAKCYVGGCSGEICSSSPDAVSACLYTASYACYKSAKCEVQANGECGWTQTDSLKMCLAENSGASTIQ